MYKLTCVTHHYFFPPVYVDELGCCVRVAILEKLGTVPEATFDDADLHQLYQAYVLLDPPGAQLL